MIRRHVSVASASAACLLVTSVGRAQAGDEHAPPASDSDPAVAARQEGGADRERTASKADGDQSDDGNWMLAAGVTSSPYPDGGVGPEVIIERRLSPRWWVLLGAEISFGQSRNYQDDELQGAQDRFLVGGGLGLRFVANPQDDLQFSAFGVVGGSYSTEEWEYHVDGSHGEFIQGGISGRLGIALEMDIVDGFGLRLSTSLARLGYYMGTTDIGGLVSHDSSGLTGGLSFRPGAALRLRF